MEKEQNALDFAELSVSSRARTHLMGSQSVRLDNHDVWISGHLLEGKNSSLSESDARILLREFFYFSRTLMRIISISVGNEPNHYNGSFSQTPNLLLFYTNRAVYRVFSRGAEMSNLESSNHGTIPPDYTFSLTFDEKRNLIFSPGSRLELVTGGRYKQSPMPYGQILCVFCFDIEGTESSRAF